MTAYWVNSDFSREEALQTDGNSMSSGERELLVRLTAIAKEVGFNFRRESNDFLMRNPEQIAPFFSHTCKRWEAIFGYMDLDLDAQAMAEGEKQVKVIMDAEADVGGDDVDIAGFDDQVTKGAQMKAFAAILATPSALDGSVVVSKANQEIINSVVAGQSSDVMSQYVPLEQRRAWQQKQIQIDSNRNKALQSLRQFIRINPRATDLEIQRHIRGNEKLIRSGGSSIISAPPTRRVSPLLQMESEAFIKKDLEDAAKVFKK